MGVFRVHQVHRGSDTVNYELNMRGELMRAQPRNWRRVAPFRALGTENHIVSEFRQSLPLLSVRPRSSFSHINISPYSRILANAPQFLLFSKMLPRQRRPN
jgi:hypothetical protein